MTHVWKIGDWCEAAGDRGFTIDVSSNGVPHVYLKRTGLKKWTPDAKHLPLCDSWDWQPPSPPDVGEGYRAIDPAVDVPEDGDEIWYTAEKVWGGRPKSFRGEPFIEGIHYRRKLPTYTPFTAETFRPHRDRWMRLATDPPGAGAFRVDSYDEYGYRLGNDLYPWHLLLDDGYVFDDDNTPCGVPQ